MCIRDRVKITAHAYEKSRDSLQLTKDLLDSKYNEVTNVLSLTKENLQQSEEAQQEWENKYTLLKENSEEKIKKNIAENNALLKEIALRKTELQSRGERVDQLEQMIQSQQKALQALKESISNALLNFEGKGLTVEQRSGKVYISMENKLLFKSGRWDVQPEGRAALTNLAAALENNPDISILIEGHTDNIPFTPNGQLESNWDLSTKSCLLYTSPSPRD